MFTRILVPLDLSSRNERALRTAFALARQNRGSVTLVHVIQELVGARDRQVQAFYRRLLRTAESKLVQAARRFGRSDVRVRTEVVIGDPPAEIVRAVRRHRASLVVMGSHRVDPRWGTRGWGTISHRVGIIVPCPVLLVK
jgi:nucleotide-binding universal stress UspA family protein